MPSNIQHPQYDLRGLIPAAVGLIWLSIGTDAGPIGLLLGLPAGLLLTSTGVAACAYAGDARINHTMAFAGVLGVLMAVIGVFAYGLLTSIYLIALSILAALVSGWLALRLQPVHPDVERPEMTPRMALKVLPDNALLGYFIGTARIPVGDRARRVADEVQSAVQTMRAQGWIDAPETFHAAPDLPADVTESPAKAVGHDYSHVRWTSGYAPKPELPGSDRFAGYTRNREMHGWMLRHDDDVDSDSDSGEGRSKRPWLMAVHGYRMGRVSIDFSLFSPGWLHHKLGFNVFMPLLPLHGHRRAGLRSGDGYLEGEFLDLLNAQAQALFDLRTAMHWLQHAQGAERIGLMGYSLGGYNAALLSGYQDNLECLICGIPVVDFASALWRNFPAVPRAGMETLGIDDDLLREFLTPVAPLTRPCLAKHRAVFGGLADQLIPQDQVIALAEHFGLSEPKWFAGSHMSIRRETVVRRIVEAEMVESGLISEAVARGELAAAH